MSCSHDVIVIGAGSAGLTAAGGCAMFGLKTVLIEAGKMGGDCLNTGCVPSKALIASAARAHQARREDHLGVALPPPHIDFAAVHAHVRGAIAAIAPEDSQPRFEAMGVEVIRARAAFVARRTVEAGGRRLSAPRIVIATGSRPRVPDIPGLERVPFLTNETLFGLDELPRHLVILGGGPIGLEMSQAFRRLGAEVTVIDRGALFPKDDPEAAAIVVAALKREGVRLETETNVARVERAGADVELTLKDGRKIAGSHLLVAAGRIANVDELRLDRAAVRIGENGIEVDGRRRTSNHAIFAIGDCRPGPRFTHVSGYEGSIATVNIALGWPAKVDWRTLPWVTYTDPELGQIGLTEAAARERFGSVDVVREDFAHNDRAVTEGEIEGFLKIICHRGHVVGATVVGWKAGELLLPWTQIITGKASLFALGSAMIAYPSRSEISKAVAFAAVRPTIFGRWPKRWARLLARIRR